MRCSLLFLLLILSAGCRIEGKYLLHSAVSAGESAVARTLLIDGADPNQTDLNGSTPLHIAASLGRIDMVGLLAEFGATNGIYDRLNRRAADYAAQNGDLFLEKFNRTFLPPGLVDETSSDTEPASEPLALRSDLFDFLDRETVDPSLLPPLDYFSEAVSERTGSDSPPYIVGGTRGFEIGFHNLPDNPVPVVLISPSGKRYSKLLVCRYGFNGSTTFEDSSDGTVVGGYVHPDKAPGYDVPFPLLRLPFNYAVERGVWRAQAYLGEKLTAEYAFDPILSAAVPEEDESGSTPHSSPFDQPFHFRPGDTVRLDADAPAGSVVAFYRRDDRISPDLPGVLPVKPVAAYRLSGEGDDEFAIQPGCPEGIYRIAAFPENDLSVGAAEFIAEFMIDP